MAEWANWHLSAVSFLPPITPHKPEK